MTKEVRFLHLTQEFRLQVFFPRFLADSTLFRFQLSSPLFPSRPRLFFLGNGRRHDLGKSTRIKTGSPYERPVDVRFGEKFGGVVRRDTSPIENACF